MGKPSKIEGESKEWAHIDLLQWIFFGFFILLVFPFLSLVFLNEYMHAQKNYANENLYHSESECEPNINISNC